MQLAALRVHSRLTVTRDGYLAVTLVYCDCTLE